MSRNNYFIVRHYKKLDYCGNKTCYDKRGAQTAKNKAEKDRGQPLRIYNCPQCGKWHLTHVDPFGRDGYYKKK